MKNALRMTVVDCQAMHIRRARKNTFAAKNTGIFRIQCVTVKGAHRKATISSSVKDRVCPSVSKIRGRYPRLTQKRGCSRQNYSVIGSGGKTKRLRPRDYLRERVQKQDGNGKPKGGLRDRDHFDIRKYTNTIRPASRKQHSAGIKTGKNGKLKENGLV